jgi:hypothetical protein
MASKFQLITEVGKNDNSLLDAEPDEGDIEPITRSREYER